MRKNQHLEPNKEVQKQEQKIETLMSCRRLILVTSVLLAVLIAVSLLLHCLSMYDSAKIAAIELGNLQKAVQTTNAQAISVLDLDAFVSNTGDPIYQMQMVELDADGMVALSDHLSVKAEVRQFGAEDWSSYGIVADFGDQLEIRITFRVTTDSPEALGIVASSIGYGSTESVGEILQGQTRPIKETYGSEGKSEMTLQSTGVFQFYSNDWLQDNPTYFYLSETMIDKDGRRVDQAIYPAVRIFPKLGTLGYRKFRQNSVLIWGMVIVVGLLLLADIAAASYISRQKRT